MPDPRFFQRAGPFSLAALAQRCAARLPESDAKADRLIADVAPLHLAGPECVSFLDNLKYLAAFQSSKAGAVFVRPDQACSAPPGCIPLLSEQPYRAFALAAQAFYPPPTPEPGIHPSAIIDPAADIDASAAIGPACVIAAGVRIGPSTALAAQVTLGPGVEIGAECRIGAQCSISHAVIGQRVTLVRIGQEGFGFAMDGLDRTRLPQLGRVIIEDDVEIGANTTIDRGAGPDTVIGRGAMIDNLVQIGHNVRIGAGAVIVAQVGLSGSTEVGEGAVLAGQVGVAGHLKIGAGARIAGQTGIFRDVEPGAEIMGYPAVPLRQFFRQVAILERLTKKGAKRT